MRGCPWLFRWRSGVQTICPAQGGGFETVYAKGLENSTIATWLQGAGYRTALFGKYLNGYPNGAPTNTYIPPGWTRWFSPNGGGPYSEYNYTLNQNGRTVAYGSAPEDYLDDVISRTLPTFIRNTTTSFPNQPFFAFVAPFAPHAPATPPLRYENYYPGEQAPRTASFNEADVSDKPAWVRSLPLLAAAELARIDELYRKRRASLLAVTDLVRDLIDALAAQGVLDNTYIFFTSDNGFHLGQHRLHRGKNTAYEEDLNVPLVVRGPGVPAGQVVRHLTANVDLAPTLAELAGVTPPGFVDGRSLVPFLEGTTPPVWRLALLNEHAGPSSLTFSDGLLEPRDPADAPALIPGVAPVYLGLRTKAVVSTALKSYGPLNYVAYDTGEHELYDVAADPAQLRNAYDSMTAADPALRRKLDAWIGALKDAAGRALREAEEAVP